METVCSPYLLKIFKQLRPLHSTAIVHSCDLGISCSSSLDSSLYPTCTFFNRYDIDRTQAITQTAFIGDTAGNIGRFCSLGYLWFTAGHRNVLISPP